MSKAAPLPMLGAAARRGLGNARVAAPRRIACAAALALLAAAAPAVEVPQVQADEPRAFGHQVGDLVRRRVTLLLPPDWRLDEQSAPRSGARGRAVELRRVWRDDAREDGGRRVSFDLEYQVFLAPSALRTVEIAPWRLRVRGPAREEELRVEGAVLTVAPLVLADAPARRGLGELQPDAPPPAIDTQAWRLRLAAWALLALVPLGMLAAVHVGLPWQAARRRPFGQAWRALRGLAQRPVAPGSAGRAQWRRACRTLHRALDRAAGRTVFASGLDDFVAAEPRYAPLRDELARFLTLSRREFFGDGAIDPAELAWLVGLARRLRDAERGGH